VASITRMPPDYKGPNVVVNVPPRYQKAKGRPPLEPRIAQLEKQLDALQQQLSNLAAQNLNRLLPSNVPHETYESKFDRWPGNGTPR
jgi:hypothetical protein